MTLQEAVAERVRALARTRERLGALDEHSPGHLVQEADAEAVLRQALSVLSTQDGYEAARRLLLGENVIGGDEMARAGLVVWDPASDAERPTPLLIELMKVVGK